MKSQTSIPTTKVARASQFVKTGFKIGGNYLKHYSKKLVDPDTSRDELHEDNATDIYASLSELKGSALKVAQMMSMDKNLLPKAYSQRFTMAQYSAPPLSGPLVVKTFQKSFGKSPQQLFDKFGMEAANAASIGQVHEAWLNGQRLAVKIQYPGIGDSVTSDLRMVRPFAVRILGLSEKDIDRYMAEVGEKLLEETDYELELRRSLEISAACAEAGLQNIAFTRYYPEYSSKRILTMDWLEGMHLKEFLLTNPSQAVRNRIGQALWDFYDFQIHSLLTVHADPHPGNFLLRSDGTLGIIDFGCVKVIPRDYYDRYFALINPDTIDDQPRRTRIFYELEFLTAQDSPAEVAFFTGIFDRMILLLGKPFHTPTFDFADDAYFQEIYAFSDQLTKMPELRDSKSARGSQHSLYINRTYFGLYSMLNDLRAEVTTKKPAWLEARSAVVG